MKKFFTHEGEGLNEPHKRQGDLRLATGLSAAINAKMSEDGNVTTEILARICEVLDCNLEQIAVATMRSGKNEDKPQSV